VEGILIEPVGGVKKGQGAPTILDVHGGPEAHESNGWNTNYGGPGQVAAGRGYAVFLPNYRGSNAYGVAFSKAHQGDYAGKEFNDLVDAKQALVAMGITDPGRVGITGGSYGGYATAWAATALSEEFAAGVMFVGISNQISKFGTTEIPREMYLVHSRKWPWEDWQFMLERSPIYHAGKARTPLLILHGMDDTRVDPEQSFQLYRNIKLRTDTPVRLVLYPGEGHGNRRAAARYDYNLRMMRWFDRYLKPAQGKGTAMPPPRLDLPAAIMAD
jgi:dipeptidyl aminopeptidase/acylaminoacyl peptidase